MEYSPSRTDSTAIAKYLELAHTCFPNVAHFTHEYFHWLYAQNPAGAVVGCDANDQGRIVAHVATLPLEAILDGQKIKALLALNVATLPNYRGKSLFRILAERIMERGADEGYTCMIGVSNQNALYVWTKRLGFQDVGGLDVRLGPGLLPKIDLARAEQTARFQHTWNRTSLQWRLRNPVNHLRAVFGAGGVTRVLGSTQNPFVAVETDLSIEFGDGFEGAAAPSSWWPPVRMSVGLTPEGCTYSGLALDLPDRLKPSPLRLIYRNLNRSSDRLEKNAVLFRFIDFDAF